MVVGLLVILCLVCAFVYHGVSWELTKKYNEELDAYFYAELDGEYLTLTVRLADTLRDERNFLVIDNPYDDLYVDFRSLISSNITLDSERSSRGSLVFEINDYKNRTYSFRFIRKIIGEPEYDKALPIIYIYSEKDWMVMQETSSIPVRHIEQD
ncbi:hypothetical protein B4U37_17220 [Sutcliffiella horikoshii]|uniref:Uncharacterized protein n=1 Tax=Sutcliffiella horikoshii TaxID=79883 RepID=A0ABM6KMW6_9BACI|nr:hypothetical protein B4U37_17220 [Sutcliffiella horikoshii]